MAMYERYVDGSTLQEVGEVLGITRERVRQLLKKGSKRSLFVYPLPKRKPPFADDLLSAYKREMSNARLAKRYDISQRILLEWFVEVGITKEDLERVAFEGKKELALDRYLEFVESIGMHPTTTVIQRQNKKLYAMISRYWGTYSAFREEFSIPAPALGNPNFAKDVASWISESKRRKEERREAVLSKVLEVLRIDGPLSFLQMRERIDSGEILLREVLTTGIKEEAIERFGARNSARYRLKEESLGRRAIVVVPPMRNYENRVSASKLREPKTHDPIAKFKEAERRKQDHAALCDLLADHVRRAGLSCEDSTYVDLLIGAHVIVEVKTVESDALDQVRLAVSQLLYYRYIYKATINSPILIALFSILPTVPNCDVSAFLAACDIEILWVVGKKFSGSGVALQALRIAP